MTSMASVLPLLLGSSIITAATPTNKTLPHLMFILQDDLYVHNDKARIIKLTPTTLLTVPVHERLSYPGVRTTTATTAMWWRATLRATSLRWLR